MPIAKSDLYLGFTLVAAKGTYVSNSSVEANGWTDLVEPGEDPVVGGVDTSDDLAPKGPPQKGE